MQSITAEQIVADWNEEILSKLHFFRVRNGIPIPTFLEKSQLFEQNNHLDQLLKFGLIQEDPPTSSYIFYRERMEDFVFVKCDKEIQKIRVELERLAQKSESNTQGINDFQTRINQLNDLKQAFTIMFRYSAKIPSNERYADQDCSAKQAALNILSSYDIQMHNLLPQPDNNQGEKYFKLLIQNGFWKEFGPEKCYQITKLGMDVLDLHVKKQASIQSADDLEFDKIVQEMNRLNSRK